MVSRRRRNALGFGVFGLMMNRLCALPLFCPKVILIFAAYGLGTVNKVSWKLRLFFVFWRFWTNECALPFFCPTLKWFWYVQIFRFITESVNYKKCQNLAWQKESTSKSTYFPRGNMCWLWFGLDATKMWPNDPAHKFYINKNPPIQHLLYQSILCETKKIHFFYEHWVEYYSYYFHKCHTILCGGLIDSFLSSKVRCWFLRPSHYFVK